MTDRAPNLTTRYLGLELPSPIMVGSSGLTGSLDGVKRCAAAGAGAVVLKSLFEEQITAEVGKVLQAAETPNWHAEAAEYITGYGHENAVGEYLRLIEAAKQAVAIPVIPSIHCVSAHQWPTFAKRVEAAGADALELNVFVLPTDPRRDGRENEQLYVDVLDEVKKTVSLPVALKISPFFSSLVGMVSRLSRHGADGVVMFNRFFQPDLDLERLQLAAGPFFSTPQEMYLPLRSVAQLAGKVECDLAATTGIHDGAAVVKMLLAGAAAVQVASSLYKNGIEHLTAMRDEVTGWMQRHEIGEVRKIRGRMSQDVWRDPTAFDRVQFMKQTAGLE